MKKSLSMGFTMQLDPYEPVKVNIMCERDMLPDETPEELMVSLAKEVIKDMKTVAVDCVGELKIIKQEIFDDLSDEDM